MLSYYNHNIRFASSINLLRIPCINQQYPNIFPKQGRRLIIQYHTARRQTKYVSQLHQTARNFVHPRIPLLQAALIQYHTAPRQTKYLSQLHQKTQNLLVKGISIKKNNICKLHHPRHSKNSFSKNFDITHHTTAEYSRKST